MTFACDPEIASVLTAFMNEVGTAQPPAPGDVLAHRAMIDAASEMIFSTFPDTPDVLRKEEVVKTADGAEFAAHWYYVPRTDAGAAVVYAHGGAMIAGSAAIFGPLIRQYVALTGVPFLAVDYRLAPEHSENGLSQDVFRATEWLIENAESHGVDPTRISVMGDSGGGGLAAAAAIRARDAGVALARQILIYPMLDHRNLEPQPWLEAFAMGAYEQNRMAWAAVLGQEAGRPGMSPYLSPAVLTDFSGLAPAFIEVGEIDIFRDEGLSYAQRLFAAGISCELHVYAGAPHGYDVIAPVTALTQRAMAQRVALLRSL